MRIEVTREQAEALAEIAAGEARELHIRLLCHGAQLRKDEARKLRERMDICTKLDSLLHLALLKEEESA